MNEKKTATVNNLQQELSGSEFLVFFSFTGVTGQEITRFRRELRKSGGSLKVVKNTLLDIALTRCGLADFQEMVAGPAGFISFRGDDEIKLLKAISAFARDRQDRFIIRGASQKGALVTAEQLAGAARLPGREHVLAVFCGTLGSPLMSFLLTLKAVPRALVSVLGQIAGQKESAA